MYINIVVCFQAPSERSPTSINRLVFPSRAAIEWSSSRLAFVSFLLFALGAIFFFLVVITVNNGVVDDHRYHRCNALLMVSDSCGRV